MAPAVGAKAEVGAVAPVVGGEQATPGEHRAVLRGQQPGNRRWSTGWGPTRPVTNRRRARRTTNAFYNGCHDQPRFVRSRIDRRAIVCGEGHLPARSSVLGRMPADRVPTWAQAAFSCSRLPRSLPTATRTMLHCVRFGEELFIGAATLGHCRPAEVASYSDTSRPVNSRVSPIAVPWRVPLSPQRSC